MTVRISKLTNEVIVFFREQDWDPMFTDHLRDGGTKQITVDAVRDFRTPFGSYMIIATLTVTRARAETWDLREYVHRRLNAAGNKLEMSDILAPAKARFYRV